MASANASAAIEILGVPELSSRLRLKKAMENFGEVVGCHMGTRGEDKPIVRFQTQEMAEAALNSLKAGQVWLDGVVLSAEWRGQKSDRAPVDRPQELKAMSSAEGTLDTG